MAASGAAAAAEAPPFLLNHLNDDELEVIALALTDLLAPRVAVALASTCKGLRAPTAAVVAELRQRHEAARALCRKAGTSCAAVGAHLILHHECCVGYAVLGHTLEAVRATAARDPADISTRHWALLALLASCVSIGIVRIR